MAVKLRLTRVGKTKQPQYRIVAADARSPRDGRFIEIIGQYRPRQDPSFVQIDAESALAWLRKGAQPTEQVQKLLTAEGVWAQYEAERTKPADTKLSRRGYATGRLKAPAKPAPEAPAPAPAPVAEVEASAPAADEAPADEAPAADEASADEAPADEAQA